MSKEYAKMRWTPEMVARITKWTIKASEEFLKHYEEKLHQVMFDAASDKIDVIVKNMDEEEKESLLKI